MTEDDTFAALIKPPFKTMLQKVHDLMYEYNYWGSDEYYDALWALFKHNGWSRLEYDTEYQKYRNSSM